MILRNRKQAKAFAVSCKYENIADHFRTDTELDAWAIKMSVTNKTCVTNIYMLICDLITSYLSILLVFFWDIYLMTCIFYVPRNNYQNHTHRRIYSKYNINVVAFGRCLYTNTFMNINKVVVNTTYNFRGKLVWPRPRTTYGNLSIFKDYLIVTFFM